MAPTLWKRRLLRVWKTAQAVAANVVFGFPGRKLRVIGVTGTDGKTTTVHLIVTALESAGYTVGAVSTIHVQVGTKRWTNTSKLTTPGPWALARLLAHMVRAGCHYAVVECSSHRLDQGGLWGVLVDVAVITNISREHLDYHRDFADYALAKRRLFRSLRHPAKVLPYRKNIDRGGRIATVAVVNLDDERCVMMLEEGVERKYGFTLGHRASGIGHRDLTPVSASALGNRSPRPESRSPMYIVRASGREALLHLKLPGTFNLANALAAIAVGTSQDIELARITRELSEVERIPGRMDRVEAGQPFTVLIDYAVTPAAFEALYAEIRNPKSEIRNKHQAPDSTPRIIHVFGAAGERDRGKRPLLGEIAARNADLVILTDEDPYGEDPEQILNDIEYGVRRAGLHPAPTDAPPTPRATAIIHDRTFVDQRHGAASSPSDARAQKQFLRVRDRRRAIHEALHRARPGDIVLVTGKGAEEVMAIGTQRIPWNDRRVIEEELASLERN